LDTDLEHALRARLQGDVRFDSLSKRIYSTDASMYAIEPIGVVFPKDQDDIVAAITTAAEFGVAVLPRGGATSLAGQTVGHALILDCTKYLNKILDIDREAMTARIQPGVVQDHLNRAARPHGLIFGPDTSTASRATLGGMIGNNSGGTHSVVYGMTIEHVQSLDVVLSDASTAQFSNVGSAEVTRRAQASSLEGKIYRELPALVAAHRDVIGTNFPDYWRRSGGYRLDRVGSDGSLDLAKVVTGSEGTLLVVSEATVGLVERPKVTAIAVAHFHSTAAAIASTEDALACEPFAVELLDQTILDLARKRLELQSVTAVLDGEPAALLFVSFTGDTEAEAAAGVDRLAERFSRANHGYATIRAITAIQQAPLLKVRASALGLLMASATGPRRPLAFVEDTAVDPKHLAEYADRFAALLRRHDITAGFYGHCSVGCLHVRPFIDLSEPGQIETMRTIAEEVLALASEYGGSNSSEHGDGLARTEFNRAIYGDELYGAMQEFKGIFDPSNRMNPGKIVDGVKMTENLRDPVTRLKIPVRTHFNFPEGSMFGAADRCMRIGACRKSGEATMCPSYMATLEEEHSTRGRANALVAALSSDDPVAGLGEQRLHDALDLCLECKACKSECPLSVDMASLKAETLSHYYDQHGTPLSARAFGSIRRLNQLGSITAPLANAVLGSAVIRAVMERVLGIDHRRTLPRLARQSLPRWFKRSPRTTTTTGERVIVLADSFTSYTDPEIGKAAIELLRRAGYDVELESSVCCGRPQLSKGLLDEAKKSAEALIERLGDAAIAGTRIVGWEPSCILTLGDEHQSLFPADARAAAVGKQSGLVDELLLEAIATGRLVLDERSPLAGTRVVFHGHCHQKSLVGTASTIALLRAIPNLEVIELETGCCGMAGSFGYEASHYDLSMKIGSDRLFPAINAEPAATTICATGVSCRQQITDGTGRIATHPLQLVLRALV
jgi:FAD/FMN-containing dehydrogenase/Fe-S oxidoreductase